VNLVSFERVTGFGSKMGSPLVSVIIPTHSRPALLVVALKSLLSQTYTNWESIVINDGGVDVSTWVNSLDPEGRIKHFSNRKTRGQSAARNTGLKEAAGKYIAYLDDDDCYLPEHIETLVSTLETRSYAVAYTDAYRVTGDSADRENRGDRLEIPFSEDFERERLLVCNYIPLLTLMHQKSLLEGAGFFDERLNILEDWDLLIRLSQEVTFLHVPRVTCKFTVRVGDAGHVNSLLARQLKGFRIIYERYPVDDTQVLRRRIEMLKRLTNEARK